MTCLKELKKWLREINNPKIKQKEWDHKAKLQQINALSNPKLLTPFPTSKWFMSILKLTSKTKSRRKNQSKLFLFLSKTALIDLVRPCKPTINSLYKSRDRKTGHKFTKKMKAKSRSQLLKSIWRWWTWEKSNKNKKGKKTKKRKKPQQSENWDNKNSHLMFDKFWEKAGLEMLLSQEP